MRQLSAFQFINSYEMYPVKYFKSSNRLLNKIKSKALTGVSAAALSVQLRRAVEVEHPGACKLWAESSARKALVRWGWTRSSEVKCFSWASSRWQCVWEDGRMLLMWSGCCTLPLSLCACVWEGPTALPTLTRAHTRTSDSLWGCPDVSITV